MSRDQTSRFVAYYRISTSRQGQFVLGAEVQRATVADFVAERGSLVSKFTEVENKKHNDWPQLAAALEVCSRQKAALVIAKLGLLTRNVHFVSQMLESRVEFVAMDNPHATKLLLPMLAAFAEHERNQISERITAALAAAKARGVKLGNPDPASAAALGRAVLAAKAGPGREKALPIIWQLSVCPRTS